jgi:hypothetical protein
MRGVQRATTKEKGAGRKIENAGLVQLDGRFCGQKRNVHSFIHSFSNF